MLITCNPYDPHMVDAGRALKRYSWLSVTRAHPDDRWKWTYVLTHNSTGLAICGFRDLTNAKIAAHRLDDRIPDPLRLTCSRNDRRWARCGKQVSSILRDLDPRGLPVARARNEIVLRSLAGDWPPA